MTGSAQAREHWREARVNARADGLVPALTLLGRAFSTKVPPRGPRGHAVLPKELLDEFAAMEAEADAESGSRSGSASGEDGPMPGLAVLRPGEGAGTRAGAGEPSARSDPASRDWNTGLAWLRLGASERLRDACIAYLAAREVEGTSLLMQQMVKGALADVLIDHLEIEGVLDDLAEGIGPFAPQEPMDEQALGRLQAQITQADRTLLRLLGAHGFTAEGPGMTAHASELIADAYCGAQHVRAAGERADGAGENENDDENDKRYL
ncbi:hypothetical protein [Streptomyces sp. NPDC054866]